MVCSHKYEKMCTHTSYTHNYTNKKADVEKIVRKQKKWTQYAENKTGFLVMLQKLLKSSNLFCVCVFNNDVLIEKCK